MSNDNDLTDTIAPKSDQLNADDLITGPITVKIIDVRRGSKDQPVIIDIPDRMPFKPCKTVLRILITAWGPNGKEWAGRSMTLFCDPTVKWAGVALGGIRVSHLSHIDGVMNMMLTVSRGKKTQHVVHPIVTDDHSEVIKKYCALEAKEEKEALWSTLSADQRKAIIDDHNKPQQET